jgi:predicted nucleic acid-binding protein
VADASALVEYLLRTERSGGVEREMRARGADVHVPALCDVEVTAVLRRALLSGVLTSDRAEAALADYVDLPLTRHGHQVLLKRILSLRANFSAYDATYVALAEQLGAALLTTDMALGRAVRAQRLAITLPD